MCIRDRGQVLGGTQAGFGLRLQKSLFQCNGDFFCKSNADKAACGQCVAVMNEAHGLGCTNYLVASGAGGVNVVESGVHVNPLKVFNFL